MINDMKEILITEEQIQAEMDEQMQNLTATLTQQGLTLEQYCSFMNTTVEALRADAEPTAKAMLRNQAAIFEICKLEDLEATQEEIGEAVAVICRQNNMTLEELQETMDPSKYVGRAKEQVDAFIANHVKPILEANADLLGVNVEINV